MTSSLVSAAYVCCVFTGYFCQKMSIFGKTNFTFVLNFTQFLAVIDSPTPS